MKKAGWLSYALFPGVLGGGMALAWGVLGQVEAERYPMAVAGIVALAGLAVAIGERVIPYREEWNRSQGDLGTDLLHMVFSFSAVVKLVEAGVWAATLGAAAWLAGVAGTGLWPTSWPLPAQLAFGLVLSELGLYAIHRWAHEVPWLWRLHAVHHSAPRLYWLNAGRFHPLDVAVQSVPGMLPLALLGAPPAVLFLHWTLTGVHGLLQHCNADMRLGPLNLVFSTAALHRWHHSARPEEADRNYGKVLALWDWVFRSRYLPQGQVGALGLGKSGFPGGFWAQLAAPLAWRDSEGMGGEGRIPERQVAPSKEQVRP